MLVDQGYLDLCIELSEAGLTCPVKVGERVGRRFADFGCEVYLVHPHERLMSLFTGDLTTLDDQVASELFWIPSVDGLVDALLGEGVVVEALEFKEQRDWIVHFSSDWGGAGSAQGRSVEEACARGLLEVLKRGSRVSS